MRIRDISMSIVQKANTVHFLHVINNKTTSKCSYHNKIKIFSGWYTSYKYMRIKDISMSIVHLLEPTPTKLYPRFHLTYSLKKCSVENYSHSFIVSIMENSPYGEEFNC